MTPRTPVVSGTAITAAVLGIVGLLAVIILIPGLKPVGALLAVAGIIVAVFAIVNRRRSRSTVTVALVGAVLGVIAVVWATVYALT